MTLAVKFLSLTSDRRALAFEQAVAGMAGQAVILEKDFWVSWLLGAKSPIVYFQYPSTQKHGFEYVRREVKLDLGTLTDQQPTGRYPIRPLISGAFPALFADWQCTVVALELQCTFWEKATTLHAEHHRPMHKSGELEKPCVRESLGALRFGTTRQLSVGAAQGPSARFGA